MDVAAPAHRFDPATLLLVVALHVAALFGLARAFAPDLFAPPSGTPVATLTQVRFVPQATPTPEPIPQARPDSGVQGAPGRKAVPREDAVPRVAFPLARATPAPAATSTGAANTSGTADAGSGTGAGGMGTGTGSGYGGPGGGGLVEPTGPVKVAGDINSAADYPTPPGGRQTRKGTFVEIVMTVGVDGRARDCRVTTPSPDPEADRITCRLAEQRFRFEPARDGNGDPVPHRYGWRQRWF